MAGIKPIDVNRLWELAQAGKDEFDLPVEDDRIFLKKSGEVS